MICSSDTTIVVSPRAVSSEVGSEEVILNTQTGIYFGLGGVGRRVWQLIQSPVSVRVLEDTIIEEFDVQPATCRADVARLLSILDDKGLILLQQGPAAAS